MFIVQIFNTATPTKNMLKHVNKTAQNLEVMLKKNKNWPLVRYNSVYLFLMLWILGSECSLDE
jgi:hypothetical protein